MGEEQQAKQALLALVCANQFKPLDPPVADAQADAAQAAASGVRRDEESYKELHAGP